MTRQMIWKICMSLENWQMKVCIFSSKQLWKIYLECSWWIYQPLEKRGNEMMFIFISVCWLSTLWVNLNPMYEKLIALSTSVVWICKPVSGHWASIMRCHFNRTCWEGFGLYRISPANKRQPTSFLNEKIILFHLWNQMNTRCTSCTQKRYVFFFWNLSF